MVDRPVDEAGDELGWRAHLLVDAVCEMMQELWGSGESRRDDILDAYSWDEDPELSRVKIGPEAKLDLQNAGIDLKLAVQAGKTQFQETSMRESFRSQEATGDLQSYLSTTPVVIKCVGARSAFSHMVAAECAIRLQDNARTIQNAYAFNQFKVVGYGAPKPIDDDGDGPFVTPVSVEIVVEHSSILPA